MTSLTFQLYQIDNQDIKNTKDLEPYQKLKTALNVFADEACIAGDTLVSTPFGLVQIQELCKTHKDDKFLVYCYDFKKMDYALGWAHSPRKTKTAETVMIMLENGKKLECTPDHKVLMRDGTWKNAGDIKEGDYMMPFIRQLPAEHLNKLKTKQFPRIWTHRYGWLHERRIC